MSVYLKGPGVDATNDHNDGDEAEFAYQVSEGGVLRIVSLIKGNSAWVVTREYSPAAWSEVSGKRYVDDVTSLGGFLGGSVKAPAGKFVSFSGR